MRRLAVDPAPLRLHRLVIGALAIGTALLAAFSPPAQAQLGSPAWAAVGPHGVNGWPIKIVFDPSEVGVVSPGATTRSVWRAADDGGATWRRLPAYGVATDASALAVGSRRAGAGRWEVRVTG